MKFVTVIAIFVLVILSLACTSPHAIKYRTLYGVESQYAARASSLLPDTTRDESARVFWDAVLVSAVDTSFLFAWCDVYPDFIDLSIYFFNRSGADIYFDPTQCYITDGFSIVQTQIMPHQVANLLVSYTEAIPPYTPKYTYEVETEHRGRFDVYDYGTGHYSGRYDGSSESEITAKEDPYNKLAWSIGAAITKRQNRKLSEYASFLYQSGLVYCQVPDGTALMGSLYWLNKIRSYPLRVTLNVGYMNFELEFDLPTRN